MGEGTDFTAEVTESYVILSSKASSKIIERLPIVIATQEHRNYILSTWVRSYEAYARKVVVSGGASGTIHVPSDTYRSGESAVAELHWEKCHVVTGTDSYTIHAWVCATKGNLWHVYVPPQLRGKGIAKGLVGRFAGSHYLVSKPLPYKFSGHAVHYSPYMNGVV